MCKLRHEKKFLNIIKNISTTR